jgi:hypothetical protein
LGAVEYLEDRSGGEVEIGEAEVAEVGRNEGAEDGGAAAVEEEDFVAGKDVAGAEGTRAGGGGVDFGDKTAYGREASAPADAAHRASPRRVGLILASSMRLQNTSSRCEKGVRN